MSSRTVLSPALEFDVLDLLDCLDLGNHSLLVTATVFDRCLVERSRCGELDLTVSNIEPKDGTESLNVPALDKEGKLGNEMLDIYFFNPMSGNKLTVPSCESLLLGLSNT